MLGGIRHAMAAIGQVQSLKSEKTRTFERPLPVRKPSYAIDPDTLQSLK